jgi:hypothetical protein
MSVRLAGTLATVLLLGAAPCFAPATGGADRRVVDPKASERHDRELKPRADQAA